MALTGVNVMSRAQFLKSLRPKQSAEYLGVGLSTLWRYAKELPDFPKPRKLSARCTVFDLDELKTWRDSRIAGAQ